MVFCHAACNILQYFGTLQYCGAMWHLAHLRGTYGAYTVRVGVLHDTPYSTLRQNTMQMLPSEHMAPFSTLGQHTAPLYGNSTLGQQASCLQSCWGRTSRHNVCQAILDQPERLAWRPNPRLPSIELPAVAAAAAAVGWLYPLVQGSQGGAEEVGGASAWCRGCRECR
jgi:hypothetical protein